MVNGRPSWSENEPARARVAGYSGSLVTMSLTPLPMKLPPRAPKTELRPQEGEPVCGYLLPQAKVPCMRHPGHLPSRDHRSGEAMNRASLRAARR